MAEKIYDYLDYYKVDLMALGIDRFAFSDWTQANDISGESDYFMHPQVAGLVYFIEEDHAMACKLLMTKHDEDIEMK